MSINELGMNSDLVTYFPLEEYVNKINLSPSLFDHLEDTSRNFDDYMNKLSCYDRDHIVNYWVYLLYKELNFNQKIENKGFDIEGLVKKGVFFDTLTISHKRIHELHNFVMDGELAPTFEYRHIPVNVSNINVDGSEDIFWRGANPEDVNKFMNDFIDIYKHSGISLLFSNPFLVSSLMHLLFVRIHPYIDGNGRTSRIIHNIKFTEAINKLYGMKLKVSPLNLSESILLNKITYIKRIDQIYFDIHNDTNEAINLWFDFMLDMADEQIYKSSRMLSRISSEHFIVSPEEIKNNSRGLAKVLRQ